jgi:hypothetical protein
MYRRQGNFVVERKKSVSAKSITILHYYGDSEGMKSKEDLRRKVQRELRVGGIFEYDFSVVYNKE